MQPTQTAIATTLALVVVIAFFIFPGLWPFGEASGVTATNQTASTTMPTDTATDTQLVINDEVVGTGATAAAGDSVTVNYVGTFADGTVFDASAKHAETANGFTFTLGAGQVIKGWDQGVAGMKEGGKRKLVIPSALAYGPAGQGSIPPNTDLTFEIELLKVVAGN